ncbi:MAG: hypothetical protein AAGD32_01740 [Planctomycetota bacterium]
MSRRSVFARLLPNALLAAAVGTLSIATLLPAEPAQAFPTPSNYPISWELEFDYEDPRRIVVEVPGESEPKAFWYMTYRVTNNTDEEQLFLPVFEMLTSSGEVIRSDRGIHPDVFANIKARAGDAFLKESLDLSGSTLLIGDDQVQHGVAIWEEPNPELGKFTIFIGGLSGEAAPITKPDGDPLLDDQGRQILLFKTKQIDYRLLGDEIRPGNDPLEKEGESWVMR